MISKNRKQQRAGVTVKLGARSVERVGNAERDAPDRSRFAFVGSRLYAPGSELNAYE